jgi:hypothetical protein
MRDKRFIAEHRGGPLKTEQHCQLMIWACKCAKHVMSFLSEDIDDRLTNALVVGKAWIRGEASVGEARKASVAAHDFARDFSDPVIIAVARSVGHAVATAHMADHSLGSAWYALKAVKNAGKSVNAERQWQDEQLPLEIRKMVISARNDKKFRSI